MGENQGGAAINLLTFSEQAGVLTDSSFFILGHNPN
jgi:hypothetical protein